VSIPILTFHALDRSRSALSFPPPLFDQGLERLAGRGLRSLTPAGLLRELDGPAPPATNRFAVTFDDGYRSVYEHALPVLARHGFTATVFVSIGPGWRPGDQRLPPMLGRERLAWSEMREMSRLGVDFGAHTVSHPDLRALPDGEIEREMAESRRILEDRLGVAVTTFAYPFGFHDARVCAVAARLFDAAFTDRLGLAAPGEPRHALPRVETYYLRTARRFASIGRPGLARYLALRNLPRRFRRWMIERAS